MSLILADGRYEAVTTNQTVVSVPGKTYYYKNISGSDIEITYGSNTKIVGPNGILGLLFDGTYWSILTEGISTEEIDGIVDERIGYADMSGYEDVDTGTGGNVYHTLDFGANEAELTTDSTYFLDTTDGLQLYEAYTNRALLKEYKQSELAIGNNDFTTVSDINTIEIDEVVRITGEVRFDTLSAGLEVVTVALNDGTSDASTNNVPCLNNGLFQSFDIELTGSATNATSVIFYTGEKGSTLGNQISFRNVSIVPKGFPTTIDSRAETSVKVETDSWNIVSGIFGFTLTEDIVVGTGEEPRIIFDDRRTEGDSQEFALVQDDGKVTLWLSGTQYDYVDVDMLTGDYIIEWDTTTTTLYRGGVSLKSETAMPSFQSGQIYLGRKVGVQDQSSLHLNSLMKAIYYKNTTTLPTLPQYNPAYTHYVNTQMQDEEGNWKGNALNSVTGSGDVDTSDLQQQIDEILSGTAQAEVGSIHYFSTYKNRSNAGLLPFDFNNVVSKVVYASLYDEIGDMFEQQHIDAGDPASGADTFYPTPVPGVYGRSSLPELSLTDANMDFANNRIIGLPSWVTDARRSGEPFCLKVVSGTLPTGLTETCYFVDFTTSAGVITLHPTEKDAIDKTNRVTFTDAGSGEFVLTQEGIQIDDSFQGHWHNYEAERKDVQVGVDQGNDDLSDPTPGTNFTSRVTDAISDSINGTPRISNESRPTTNYLYGYIKAESVTPAGEPVSALKYDTGWVANSDWTANNFTISHDLSSELSELNIKVLFSSDGTDNNAKFPIGMAIRDAGSNEQVSLVLTKIDINSIKLSTGASGVRIGIGDGTGGSVLLSAQSYYYRVVIEKPQLTATFGYTPIRKTITINDANDVPYPLPDANNFYTEVIVKRKGAGTGQVLFTTIGSQTVPVEGLGGESTVILYPESGNWEIKSLTNVVMHVQDQKPTGTDGGSFTSGAWQTRDLNTVLTDNIVGASLALNQISLPAGIYEVDISAPAYRVDRHSIRLQNISDSLTILSGTSEFNGSGTAVQTRSIIKETFSITSAKIIEIQHRCVTTNIDDGFGSNTGFAAHETYTDVSIEKVG